LRVKSMYREKGLPIAIATSALLAVSFVGGCSSKPNDAQIVNNLQSQMFADSQLKSANLQVASIDGEVTLKGTVPNDAARYEAYKIATQASGVKKVNDQMVVDDQSAQANAAPAAAAPATTPTPAPLPAPASAQPRAANTRVAPHAKPRSSDHAVSGDNAALASNAPPSQPDANQPLPAPQSDTQQPVATPAPQAAPAPPPQPPPVRQVQIDSGATVAISMIDSIDSSMNQAGEVFHASLDQPLLDADGNTVVPKGADVYVRLASASSAGKMTGQSQLHLELVKLVYQGQTYPLVSSTYSQVGESRGKDTAKKVGAGAAIGAIIGGVIGGGKGVAIGAAGGAGAGGVYQASTKGEQVKVPSETKLNFQLEQPVTIAVQPQSQPQPISQPLPSN
jgi:hypothetical protein